MIKKLLPWNKSILFITALLLAVFVGGYAPVTACGTTGANINTRISGKYYSGCEFLAAAYEKSFSTTSGSQSYFADPNQGPACMAFTPKIANPLHISLAPSGRVHECKAGQYSRNSDVQIANPGHVQPGENIAYDILNSKFKAITEAVGLNSKTADAGIINVAYNIRYTPGLSVSGNRQAGGRVSGVGKPGYINTEQCTAELKTHRLTPGKPALQITKFDFTDYRSTCKVPLFCA
ncbi:MAG: hypothetical protein WCI92_19195 [Bacteroidota bacterium]